MAPWPEIGFSADKCSTQVDLVGLTFFFYASLHKQKYVCANIQLLQYSVIVYDLTLFKNIIC